MPLLRPEANAGTSTCGSWLSTIRAAHWPDQSNRPSSPVNPSVPRVSQPRSAAWARMASSSSPPPTTVRRGSGTQASSKNLEPSCSMMWLVLRPARSVSRALSSNSAGNAGPNTRPLAVTTATSGPCIRVKRATGDRAARRSQSCEGTAAAACSTSSTRPPHASPLATASLSPMSRVNSTSEQAGSDASTSRPAWANSFAAMAASAPPSTPPSPSTTTRPSSPAGNVEKPSTRTTLPMARSSPAAARLPTT